jgi:hypothetical protein
MKAMTCITAFAALAQLRASGLVIAGDGLFVNRSEQLAGLTLETR